MVALSGKHRFGTLIDSEVIRDRASNGSVWSGRVSLDSRSDGKSGPNSVRSEVDRMPDGVKERLKPSLHLGYK